MATTARSYSNAKTRPAAEKDRQLAPPTCDACGPTDDDLHRLDGPHGDIQVCSRCVRLLVDKAAA